MIIISSLLVKLLKFDCINILAKIFKEIDFQNLTTNEEIITKINSDFEAQSQFFDFMGRVVSRVLINLNINLPFSRSEIIQKN